MLLSNVSKINDRFGIIIVQWCATPDLDSDDEKSRKEYSGIPILFEHQDAGSFQTVLPLCKKDGCRGKGYWPSSHNVMHGYSRDPAPPMAWEG